MKMKSKVFTVISAFVFLAALVVFSAVTVRTVRAQSLQDAKQQQLLLLSYVYDFILNNYVDEVDSEKLYEGAMKGMLEALGDPYSSYLSAAEVKDLSKNTAVGEFGGIGVTIQKLPPQWLNEKSELTDGYVTIISPMAGTPGYKAGLHAGDFITHVDGESVIPWTANEAVERMTGKPGTKVTLTILRNKTNVFDVEITRAMIKTPTVESADLFDYGYIRLIQWTPMLLDDFKKAVTEQLEAGVKGLIIDVRNNPGGLLDSVCDVTDLFLSDGVIVSTKGRIPRSMTVYNATADDDLIPEELPVAVLINKGSASASEIFAGAMKDSGRAVIIGETSFGKGSVQEALSLGEDGFKLTTAKYFTPSGESIDKTGVKPDIEVTEPEMTEEELEAVGVLLKENLIESFVEENPKASEAEIDEYVNTLQTEKEIGLSDRILRRLIRNAVFRRMDFPPAYDYDYDLQLQKAVEILNEAVQ